jgi:hypothetical protein
MGDQLSDVPEQQRSAHPSRIVITPHFTAQTFAGKETQLAATARRLTLLGLTPERDLTSQQFDKSKRITRRNLCNQAGPFVR